MESGLELPRAVFGVGARFVPVSRRRARSDPAFSKIALSRQACACGFASRNSITRQTLRNGTRSQRMAGTGAVFASALGGRRAALDHPGRLTSESRIRSAG